VLARAEITEQNSELLSLSPRDAVDKLLAGEIDVAFLVASWYSPVVLQLLADDRVVLSSYPRADALVAFYPFLTKIGDTERCGRFGQRQAAYRYYSDCFEGEPGSRRRFTSRDSVFAAQRRGRDPLVGQHL
jgi:hypothetical protein